MPPADVKIKPVKGGVTAVGGFRAAGVHAGIKKARVPDLAMLSADQACATAGVFTSNRFAAAPVLLSKQHIRSGQLQAIIANSGCANACTGTQGEGDAREMAELTAKELGVPRHLVAVASTGVIGEFLPMDRIRKAIPRLAKSLNPRRGRAAAQAIMTTDTVIKEAAVKTVIDGWPLTVGGMAKGAGMVHPQMVSSGRKATMLAFLTTDASIDPTLLQQTLQTAVDLTFNMVTVDGETSTNDTVVIMANGRSKVPKLPAASPALDAFQTAVTEVCLTLAKMIARDGEGATKLVEIIIRQTKDLHEAKGVGMAIARSPLVKTAFYGHDPNWGRIMSAIGACGVDLDLRRIDLYLGGVQIVKGGMGVGKKAEERASKMMKKKSFTLTVDLHTGSTDARIWTCDLSPKYIKINAAYRS
jgi:glutamate N-acetyltransferase / amino-acid N-acetyltransferase